MSALQPRDARQLESLCRQVVERTLAGDQVSITSLTSSPDLREVLQKALARARRWHALLQHPVCTSRGLGWRPGQELRGKYTVVRPLGAGGMGEVYLVRRIRDGAELAAKRVRDLQTGGLIDILDTMASGQTRQRAMLDEIIRSMEIPDHPNVLCCRSFDIIDSGLVLFTDYARDGSLQQCLAEGRFYPGGRPTRERFTALLVQTAEGLAHLHRSGLVHQDIKPGNILIDGLIGDLRARIGDFGVSRLGTSQPAAGEGLLSADMAGFDPSYAAPEQLRARRVTNRSDIYSWALTMTVAGSGDIRWLRPTHPKEGPLDPAKLVSQIAREALDGAAAVVIDLLRSCLDPQEANRPTAEQVLERLPGILLSTPRKQRIVESRVNAGTSDMSQLDLSPPSAPDVFRLARRTVHGRWEDFVIMALAEILRREPDEGADANAADWMLDARPGRLTSRQRVHAGGGFDPTRDRHAKECLRSIQAEDDGRYATRLDHVLHDVTRSSDDGRRREWKMDDLIARGYHRYHELSHESRFAVCVARLARILTSNGPRDRDWVQNLRDATALLHSREEFGMRELVGRLERVLGTKAGPDGPT